MKKRIKKADRPHADKKPKRGHYGMWDLKDNLWLGNKLGVLTYKEKDWAFIAAGIMSRRIGRKITVRTFNEKGAQFVDKITPEHSAEKAISMIMKGK